MPNIISFLQNLGAGELPVIGIVDVGAMEIAREPWEHLVAIGAATLVGFEPNRLECQKLNDKKIAGRTYLPYALGDGETHDFYLCEAAFTSSLFRPKYEYIRYFATLSELCTVKAVSPIETFRLDDVEEIACNDFIKIDTQGAELMILQHATNKLKSCLALQVEVCFSQIYQDQPLFAEIDSFLRGQGFTFHYFTYKGTLPLKSPRQDMPHFDGTNHWLWSDAVYIRDFTQFEDLSGCQLLKMAVISHAIIKSNDVAVRALHAFDQKTQTDLAKKYFDAVRLKLIV